MDKVDTRMWHIVENDMSDLQGVDSSRTDIGHDEDLSVFEGEDGGAGELTGFEEVGGGVGRGCRSWGR